jgi:biotin carboxylase
MPTVLVETPDYLRWRDVLGRRRFDEVVPVERPADAAAVVAAVGAAGRRQGRPVALMLAGFERYVASTLTAARELDVRPAGQSVGFGAPYKRGQRAAVTTANPRRVRQPRHVTVRSLNELRDLGRAADHPTFPVVVKPGDGGGGLGVLLVSQVDGLPGAAETLAGMTNYDGGGFDGWLVEEYVKGVELSVQAVAVNGAARIITSCEKLITIETAPEFPLVSSFRESGHVAQPGEEADPVLRDFADECLRAVGYRQGPFHLDLIRDGDSLHLLEMGFRLSGMRVVELVRRVSGVDWAEVVFRIHLGDAPVDEALVPRSGVNGHRYGGQFTIRHADQYAAAERLRLDPSADCGIDVERFSPPDLPAEWRTDLPRSLRSDLHRHAGAVGRVVVTAPTPHQVARALEWCRVGRVD